MTYRRSCCVARPRTPIQLVPRFLHYIRAGSTARVGAMLAQSRRLANARNEITPYESALMLATISASDVAMIDLLLSNGASLDTLDARGRDVFIYACQYGASAAMLARLVAWCQQQGRPCSSWERIDRVSSRALILACRSLNMELIEYLMDGIASPLNALEALQTVIEIGEEPKALQLLDHPVVQASIETSDWQLRNGQSVDERTALLTRCVYTAIQLDMGTVVTSMDKLNPSTVGPIVWLFMHQQVPEHASRHFSPLIQSVERRFKREMLWASFKPLFLVRHHAQIPIVNHQSILNALAVLPKPLFDKIVQFYPVQLDCQALAAQLLAGRCCLESVVSAENCWCALMRIST